MTTRKRKPAFDRIPSTIKGAKAYKPNAAMLEQIARDMPADLINHPLMREWKKLLNPTTTSEEPTK